MLRDEIKAILDEFSPEEAYRHTKTIGETWVNRISGTKELEGSVEYIVQQLRSYGIENATAQPLEGLISLPTISEVRIVSPEQRGIDSRPFAQIGSTPDDGIEAELVFVGPGGFSDYEGRDVRGKIVLAELSYAPPRPEKARIATLKAAAGLILSNWGPSDSEIIPLGT